MDPDHVNIAEAKARFSHYIRRVRNGESFILCDRNVPVAELRPLGIVEEAGVKYRFPASIKGREKPLPAKQKKAAEDKHPAWGALSGTVIELSRDFDEPDGDADWEAAR